MRASEHHWDKASATKWLLRLLFACLALGLLSIICMWLGLVSVQVEGQGSCTEAEKKHYAALGKWNDGPKDMHLNWYVCERNESAHGWSHFGNSWYRAFCGWNKYEEASRSCVSWGAYLVSIGSREENAFVQGLCGLEACFIGLTALENNIKWVWEDGTIVRRFWMAEEAPDDVFTNWNPEDPSFKDGIDESVVFMNSWSHLDMPDPHVDAGECPSAPRTEPIASGTWYLIPQDTRIQYSVCEKESNQAGNSTCESGWSHHKGHCYKRMCAMHSGWQAFWMCEQSSSRLVSISSAEENNFVRNLCGVHTCRLGLAGQPGSEEWYWEDGTSVGQYHTWKGYTNWAGGDVYDPEGYEGLAAVMNMQEVIPSMRKTFLFEILRPLYEMWAIAQLCVPILLLVMTVMSSRCNNSCFAQAVCIVSGTSSLFLSAEILLLLLSVRGVVDDSWPAGAKTVLVFLSVVGVVQVVICCGSTSKAQELQWTTTAGWNAMGVREVEAPLQPSGAPDLEMSAEPGQ